MMNLPWDHQTKPPFMEIFLIVGVLKLEKNLSQADLQVDLQQLALAMISVKHLKSNAVCLVNDGSLVGAGAGQMDRLASTRLAIEKAVWYLVGGLDEGELAVAYNDIDLCFKVRS